MATTVWSTGCRSYFVDASGRVVTQLPQSSAWYAERTATFVLDDYLGDRLTHPSSPRAELRSRAGSRSSRSRG